MKTFTREQILKGMKRWEKSERLNPNNFMNDTDVKSHNLKDMAEIKTKTLIDFINNK